MKSVKSVPADWHWSDLVPRIDSPYSILLPGPGERFILAWEIEKEQRFEQEQFDPGTLQEFLDDNKGNYIFCFLAYDIKNKLEPKLFSRNEDLLKFPDALFVVARHVLVRDESGLHYYGEQDATELTRWYESTVPVADEANTTSVHLDPLTNREDYLRNLAGIKNEIQLGTLYEMNYCVNFNATQANLHPWQTFKKLYAATEAPFSCFLHYNEFYALSASPERYLQKKGNRLLSQPIKGTAARGADPADDERRKKELHESPKERSENVMIVDLVRNDLSRIAEKNSVKVDELFGVYSFKTVHQLISSVSCTLRPGTRFCDILSATFPMGSMTGAPKISAMQQSEYFEDFRRGLYSGTIGYIEPNGDFDLNVVIRSILYNGNERIVSCSVGGAITINSEPEKEYDECLLKLEALRKALC